MKKIMQAGLVSLIFGAIALAVNFGGGLVSADTALSDPSAQLFTILLYLAAGFIVLGLILIITATLTSRR